MLDTTARQYRTYETADIVIALARHGVAIDTLSRALVIPSNQVFGICRSAVKHGVMDRMPPETSGDKRSATYTELVNLRGQVETLREQIRNLKIPSDDLWTYIRAFKLTHMEARFLAVLVQHGSRTKEQIYHACYGQRIDKDQPEPKIIDVFVCKLRAKLKPHGVEILTRWGYGYELSTEGREKVKKLAAEVA